MFNTETEFAVRESIETLFRIDIDDILNEDLVNSCNQELVNSYISYCESTGNIDLDIESFLEECFNIVNPEVLVEGYEEEDDKDSGTSYKNDSVNEKSRAKQYGEDNKKNKKKNLTDEEKAKLKKKKIIKGVVGAAALAGGAALAGHHYMKNNYMDLSKGKNDPDYGKAYKIKDIVELRKQHGQKALNDIKKQTRKIKEHERKYGREGWVGRANPANSKASQDDRRRNPRTVSRGVSEIRSKLGI